MHDPSKFLIITTIHEPTAAILEFRKWASWQIVVVGDRKGPEDWTCDGVIYLGIKEQYARYRNLARAIPENTYVRKMLGYVYAIECGASAILESDDDNIPYVNSEATVDRLVEMADRSTGERRRSGNHWLNAYELFGARQCWPRGFPLEYIKDPSCKARSGAGSKPWAVVQFLADEDPDVDAIYRMVDGRSVYFARERRFIFDEGTYCPINSQATLWTSEAFPLLFLPMGVSDRVTDILRGYIATACLWRAGYTVAFSSPIVYQKRNMHNLLKDFQQEMPLYVNADTWCRLLLEVNATNVIDGYRSAIQKLANHGAIPRENLDIYEMFLSAAGRS